MRALILAFAVGSSVSPASAHDFWVQPQSFSGEVGQPLPLTFQVGHGAARQRWGASTNRITTFDAVGASGVRDLHESLQGSGAADATPRFATAGSYYIVMASDRATSELPAIRFEDYIHVEGLAPAVAARRAAGKTEAPGRESYSRRAKALVQIGRSSAPQPHVTRAIGLTLEIVPSRDPYAPGFDMTLPVTVMYEGKPLAGALVKLNNLDFDAHPVATHVTDSAGHAVFTIPFKGLWQMNVVWTAPIKSPTADFDTVFSSLSFGWNRPAAVLRQGG